MHMTAMRVKAGWDDDKALYQTSRLSCKPDHRIIRSDRASTRRYTGRVLPNGADVDAFTDAGNLAEPPDLKALPRPSPWLRGVQSTGKVDLKLIADVRVGPAGMAMGARWQSRKSGTSFPTLTLRSIFALRGVAKYVLSRQKNRLEVPAYVGNMDINTMCYRVDGHGWWKAGYPLKLHEYLAVGLPVISSPVESVLPFKDVVKIAKNANEWIEGLAATWQVKTRSSGKCKLQPQEQTHGILRVSQLEQWLHEATAGDSGS